MPLDAIYLPAQPRTTWQRRRPLSPQLRRSHQPGGQLLIYVPAMANRHEADDARFAVNRVDDPKFWSL